MNQALFSTVLAAALFCTACTDEKKEAPSVTAPAVTLPQDFVNTPDFSGANAYLHCSNICKLGPRLSGSAAYTAQLEYLEKHLKESGWTVHRDTFTVNGICMTNLRAVKGEGNVNRPLLLSCHIDTKTNIAPDFESADAVTTMAVRSWLPRLTKAGKAKAQRKAVAFLFFLFGQCPVIFRNLVDSS